MSGWISCTIVDPALLLHDPEIQLLTELVRRGVAESSSVVDKVVLFLVFFIVAPFLSALFLRVNSTRQDRSFNLYLTSPVFAGCFLKFTY